MGKAGRTVFFCGEFTGKEGAGIYPTIKIKNSGREENAVCISTKGLNESKDKSGVQPHETADFVFRTWGGHRNPRLSAHKGQYRE